MAHIFLSYAREDLDFAQRLAERLQRAGFSVWWDRALMAGADIEQAIDTQIREAGAVIVVWSSNAINSHWVRSEASAALEMKKLVPVRADDTRLPRPFDQIHTLDLRKWKGGLNKDIRLLINSVRTVGKGERVKKGPGKTSAPISRRRMISIGALASAGVLALAIVSDVTDLIGNLSAQKGEKALQEQIALLDERLAGISNNSKQSTFLDEEIYLRDSLRTLQTFDIPVDDIVIAMTKTQSLEEIIAHLSDEVAKSSSETPKQSAKELQHQLAALSFRKDPARSLSLYHQLIDLYPDDFSATLFLARVYINQNDPINGRKYIETAENLTPPNTASQLEFKQSKAFLLGLERDYTGGIELLARVIEDAKKENLFYQISGASSVTASMLMMLDRHEEAETILLDVIDLQANHNFHSHYAHSLYSLIEIDHHNKNFDRANARLDIYLPLTEALNRPGYVSQGYTMQGNIALAQQDLQQAEDYFLAGLAIAREHDFTGDKVYNAIGLGEVYLAKKDSKSACRFFTIATDEPYAKGSLRYPEMAKQQQSACSGASIPIRTIVAVDD